MAKYIPLDALVAEIEKLVDLRKFKTDYDSGYRNGGNAALSNLKERINSLEVKEVDNPISKFKSLLHLHADMKSTCADGGYAPNLYFFDDSWHVDWISCTEGDSLIDFTDDTPEGAIQKAYEWFHSTFKNA